MTKREALELSTNITTVVVTLAKGFTFIYLIGLCGGLENGTLTIKQFIVKAIISLAFMILG